MEDLGANPHEVKGEKERADNAWFAARAINDCSKCDTHLAAAMKTLRVKTLVQAIHEKTGHQLPINCINCQSSGIEGCARAFLSNPPPEITLCSNRLHGAKEVEEALVHELIHAYDFTARRMDLTQGKILGCSEVRAAREAECHGDRQPFFCRRLQEAAPSSGNESDKLQLDWLGRFCAWNSRRCARVTAIGATESIFPPREAQKFVDETFEDCYADCSPFKPTTHTILDNTRASDDDPIDKSGRGSGFIDTDAVPRKDIPLLRQLTDPADPADPAISSAPTACSQRSGFRGGFPGGHTYVSALRACVLALPAVPVVPSLQPGRSTRE
jgi:hypothetical protein